MELPHRASNLEVPYDINRILNNNVFPPGAALCTKLIFDTSSISSMVFKGDGLYSIASACQNDSRRPV